MLRTSSALSSSPASLSSSDDFEISFSSKDTYQGIALEILLAPTSRGCSSAPPRDNRISPRCRLRCGSWCKARRTGLRSCDGAKVKEGRLIHQGKADDEDYRGCSIGRPPWQPAHAQAIIGWIPEEFRGDWCQENTKDNIFKPGGCKLKAGSLSIDRMTLDTGRLSCGFDSGAASDGTLQMRMLCTDPEDKELLTVRCPAQAAPGKKIELILSRWIKSDECSEAFSRLS